MHGALADDVVANILARTHHAIREGLAVGPCEVAFASGQGRRGIVSAQIALPEDRGAKPSMVGLEVGFKVSDFRDFVQG
jgi:hypothetical protein